MDSVSEAEIFRLDFGAFQKREQPDSRNLLLQVALYHLETDALCFMCNFGGTDFRAATPPDNGDEVVVEDYIVEDLYEIADNEDNYLDMFGLL